MKLSNVCDEDLKEIAKLKTRKGTYTSEAKRAQQILYSRNITHGGFGPVVLSSTLDSNLTREYKRFGEVN